MSPASVSPPHPGAGAPTLSLHGERVSTGDAPANPPPPEGEGAARSAAGEGAKPARKWKRPPASLRLRTFAKDMRKAPTDAEARLWSILRDRRFAGHKFRRQVPIGTYIVDFFCASASLIVELDGSQHADSAYDSTRDTWLKSRGYTILRVWNSELTATPNSVLDSVLDSVWHALHPHPLETT